MPVYTRGDVRISYQTHGEGFPVLAIAPGGLGSVASRWSSAPLDPVQALPDHQIITMDQRNAGDSWAPISADDGWHNYTEDQLGLMDHLGIDRFHVIGMCIGGPYAVRLCLAAPHRVAAAVLLQPIGLDDNRAVFEELAHKWRSAVEAEHPEADESAWSAFASAMFGGDFMFGASRDDVASCDTPMIVAMGDDIYHPSSVSREAASLAPNATLIERWKSGDDLAKATAQIASLFGG